MYSCIFKILSLISNVGLQFLASWAVKASKDFFTFCTNILILRVAFYFFLGRTNKKLDFQYIAVFVLKR